MSGERRKNFWMTLNLLVGIDWKKNVIEDVEEWLDSVDAKRVVWTPKVRKEPRKSNTRSSAKVTASASATTSTSSNSDKDHVLQLPDVDCSFRHPKLRSRLERLMGSNLVHLTDRQYMLQLHQRILEDYIETMEKRIADREARERNREKELVLTGKIPLDKAPEGMKHHPILLINNYCQKLINEKRAKIKVPKVHIHSRLYLDDTPDPPPGLTISEGHVFRKQEDMICVPPDTHLAFSTEEDIERGYMFTEEEFERKRKYESPEIEDLELAETVEEMYLLADEIIGPLKTIKEAVTVELGPAEGVKETTEGKELIEGEETTEGEEAIEGQEATEGQEVTEGQEATEGIEATEAKQTRESKEAKETRESKEATEAKQTRESKEAKEGKETEEAQEAKEATEATEATEAIEATEDNEENEA